ncbi:Stealth CR1 domain-containing protein [Cecembia rubra]|uniref:Stealth CR1 domain-containing protein n=1 Tax=Cecembia rubra TaxID=1485585 RepID=UPI002714B31A|nr:Stealth CR1 domain-containing protein [Cecembia rubra]
MDSEKRGPIDVVIAWVDGNEPKHREKMNQYLPEKSRKQVFSTEATRFASAGEIKYCVLSILTFAPFIRKVFIVTDDQDPNLGPELEKYFPQRKDDVLIVDHKVIFSGYESYLPTFNSSTIENMLWRIPGLSENFVYFNDDMFLIRPLKEEDWFINNEIVLRGTWLPSASVRHGLRKLKQLVIKNFEPKPSYNIKQWMSAKIMGFRWFYFGMDHTPCVMKKSILEDFYTNNPDLLISNISHRFRFHTQFNVASIVNHSTLARGNKNIEKSDIAYLQPSKRKSGYLKEKLEKCDRKQNIKFLCVQNLDQCPESLRKYLWNWLENRFKFQNS